MKCVEMEEADPLDIYMKSLGVEVSAEGTERLLRQDHFDFRNSYGKRHCEYLRIFHEEVIARGAPANQDMKHEFLKMHERVAVKLQQAQEECVNVEQFRESLEASPVEFLDRFGKWLHIEDLAFFTKFLPNYEVQTCLENTFRTLYKDKCTDTDRPSFVIRNRRFNKLKQLCSDSDFFSDENIQLRCPALYHQYIGQYKPVPSSSTLQRKAAQSTEENTLLSTFLLSCYDKKIMKSRRQASEANWGLSSENAEVKNDDFVEEFDTEDEDDGEERKEETKDESLSKTTVQNVYSLPARDEIENGIASLLPDLREQLMDIMHQRFLHGQEAEHIDYALIDQDISLDDYEQWNRDAQDRYFDEEAL